MVLIVIGSMVFVFGLMGIKDVFGWLITTAGLVMALRGVAGVTAELVARKLDERKNDSGKPQ